MRRPWVNQAERHLQRVRDEKRAQRREVLEELKRERDRTSAVERILLTERERHSSRTAR